MASNSMFLPDRERHTDRLRVDYVHVGQPRQHYSCDNKCTAYTTKQQAIPYFEITICMYNNAHVHVHVHVNYRKEHKSWLWCFDTCTCTMMARCNAKGKCVIH